MSPTYTQSDAHNRARVRTQVLLADPRADPTCDEQYAIGVAAQNGHASVVELLLAETRVGLGLRV
jgi:hypothetical protein